MDLSTIVRREMHAPLAWLGQLFPWFEVEDVGDLGESKVTYLGDMR